MEFDKGYVSAYMITNPERMEAVAKDAPILVTDKKISTIKDILPLLEKIAQAGKKDLVIIADDVDGEALATFVVNKLRGVFNVLAVKAPGYGDRKKEMLADIAIVVGASVISEDLGLKLENAELDVLGKAQRVVATKDSTVIVGGKGKKSDIEKRVASLRKQLENTDSKFDKEKIEERIAKLTGGVAVIRVGAATETEMKYLKDKIEDAVNSTKAAIAAFVEFTASSILSFRYFISVSVAAPTRITATPPVNFAMRSSIFSLSPIKSNASSRGTPSPKSISFSSLKRDLKPSREDLLPTISLR